MREGRRGDGYGGAAGGSKGKLTLERGCGEGSSRRWQAEAAAEAAVEAALRQGEAHI